MSGRFKTITWLTVACFFGAVLIALLRAFIPQAEHSVALAEIEMLCRIGFGGGLIILLGERWTDRQAPKTKSPGDNELDKSPPAV